MNRPAARPPGARRHSWEKLEIHRYRCRREDCGAVAEKIADEHGPGYSTRWTLADGTVHDTRRGDRTPVCEPVQLGMEIRHMPRPCRAVAGGVLCDRNDARLYPAGARCDDHAPWSTWAAGDGQDPALKGQYCMVGGHRVPAPDSASWAAVDARAIASGKRRSGEATYAAARAVVDVQKADRRTDHLSGITGRTGATTVE